jgi:uncharacterized protein (AIM24 family)
MDMANSFSLSLSLCLSLSRACLFLLVSQKLEGTGTVFLASTGTIVQKVLQNGEVWYDPHLYNEYEEQGVLSPCHFVFSSIFLTSHHMDRFPNFSVVDTNCLLAYSNSCKFDLKVAGGIVGMFGGGEGIFNSTITGPGLVIMQSMNLQLLLDSLAADKIYRR